MARPDGARGWGLGPAPGSKTRGPGAKLPPQPLRAAPATVPLSCRRAWVPCVPPRALPPSFSLHPQSRGPLGAEREKAGSHVPITA